MVMFLTELRAPGMPGQHFLLRYSNIAGIRVAQLLPDALLFPFRVRIEQLRSSVWKARQKLRQQSKVVDRSLFRVQIPAPDPAGTVCGDQLKAVGTEAGETQHARMLQRWCQRLTR